MSLAHQDGQSPDPAKYFGMELRLAREQRGLRQEDLAGPMGYTASMISHVERGFRPPTRSFAIACDAALSTGGTFLRIWSLIARQAHPAWFGDWVELERTARTLRDYELTVVPGLLQTEAYVENLIKAAQPGISAGRLRELIEARLERHSILDQDDGPVLWTVLDHTVLARKIGSNEVMKDQLERLVEATRHPRISVQVIPEETSAHPGLTGAFVIASFDQGPDALYLQTAWEGQIIHGTDRVDHLSRQFTRLQAEALPIKQSRDYIVRMAERWT